MRSVAAALLLASALPACCGRSSPSPSASSSPSASASVEPVRPSRCSDPLGALTLGDERGATEDDLLPFAVEVGDGITTESGFALGALTREDKQTVATVVTLSREGGSPRKTVLGGAHGDTQPPRLASKGSLLMVGLLDSESAGRRLRIGKVNDGAVTWTSSFEQGRDESFAFDLAIGASRAIAVWDDDARDPERGVIRVATVAANTLLSPSLVRTVTLPQTDAESPRVIPRAGGFWLAWIARRPERTDDNAREPGEEAQYRWLEVAQLDENGAALALPRRVTSIDGHVIAYTLRPGADGSAVLVYRDDDTPSGASGGSIARIAVRADGTLTEVTTIAETSVGVGAPALVDGWMAIADASSETRLARVSPAGDLLDTLSSEPILGRGEVLAASGDLLLVSRPRGASVRLFVTRCGAPTIQAAPPSSEILLPTAPPALPLPELPAIPSGQPPVEPLPRADLVSLSSSTSPLAGTLLRMSSRTRTRARAVAFTCWATVAISREAAADTDVASSLFFVGGETHLDHAKLHAPPTTAEPDLLKNRRLTLDGSGRELGGGVMLTLTTHDTRIGFAIAVIGVQHATAVVDPMPANVGVKNDSTWGEHIEVFVGRSIDFKTVRPYLDIRGTFCLLQTSVGLVTPAYGFTGSAPYNVFAFGVGPRLGTWISLGKFAFADVAIQYDAVGPERLTGMLGLGVHAGLD